MPGGTLSAEKNPKLIKLFISVGYIVIFSTVLHSSFVSVVAKLGSMSLGCCAVWSLFERSFEKLGCCESKVGHKSGIVNKCKLLNR